MICISQLRNEDDLLTNVTKKTLSALKWSSITELLSKIISPIINMILARILAPEDFGVLATITMVISFAEIFVESGFQKILIQHIFESEKRERECMSVAFWANLAFSFLIWGIIIIFRVPLAKLAGNEKLGVPLSITGVTIPLLGVIGIQNCLLKKRLEFKSLFFVRIISALVPLIVTLPLAVLGYNYWALIIGNIAGIVARSIILILVGKFRPLKYFSFSDFRFLLSSGIWTILDGIAVWATAWIDSLLIAYYMSDYYLGLYKNSSSMVTSIFGIVVAALTPVLFSSLSKLQNNEAAFNKLFLKTQKVLCIFLLPLGVGIFLYRELTTTILFGNRWIEAADVVGVMAISTSLRTIFISIYGDVYRAKGRFRIPLLLQLLDLLILVPSCLISVRFGFWSLVYTRAVVRLDLVIPEMVFVFLICRIKPNMIAKAVIHPVIATTIMAMVALGLKHISNSVVWSISSIILCIVVYFSVLFAFKSEREELLQLILNKIKSFK